jgi:hypothetical protein
VCILAALSPDLILPKINLEQDQQLDHLSHSINRQHHISLQINEELDVHHGLLTELDADIDSTQSRLGKARQKLDHVARGVKNNGWYFFCLFLFCFLFGIQTQLADAGSDSL